MPGPAPKPTALKLLEGNPGKRKLNENEPTYEPTATPPDWLTEDALVVWNKFCKELKATGILTTVDVNAFGRYCDAFAQWLKLKDFINKNGTSYPIYEKETVMEMVPSVVPGKMVEKPIKKKVAVGAQAFPQAKQYKEISELLLRMEQQFGMTPASRTKLTGTGGSSGGGEEDDFY